MIKYQTYIIKDGIELMENTTNVYKYETMWTGFIVLIL